MADIAAENAERMLQEETKLLVNIFYLTRQLEEFILDCDHIARRVDE
ncbi:hypothetical protein ACXHXM_06040